MCVWRSQAEVSALRAEVESARTEGAASLAMEHGKRQALDEAHREAQATGTRLRGELRAAREEVDRLRRERSFCWRCFGNPRTSLTKADTIWLLWLWLWLWLLSGRLSFEGSARAELEQQLAVAVNEAQSQAAQAVGRQRRAAARATAAEKALFARDELRQLAEAVAERQADHNPNTATRFWFLW